MTPVPLWPTNTISYREIDQITSNVLGFSSKGYSRTIFTLLLRQRFNPTMVSYSKSWAIKLIGYSTWTVEYMHTENHW
jgi:hypothetical protein